MKIFYFNKKKKVKDHKKLYVIQMSFILSYQYKYKIFKTFKAYVERGSIYCAHNLNIKQNKNQRNNTNTILPPFSENKTCIINARHVNLMIKKNNTY